MNTNQVPGTGGRTALDEQSSVRSSSGPRATGTPPATTANLRKSPEHRMSLTMVSNDRAPSSARTFTRERLSAWGLEDLLDRTVLIVSELTTNAERHGGTPSDTEHPAESKSQMMAERITLTLSAQDGIVGIEVEDNSPLPPIPRATGPDSLDGRGLLLVTAEADAWTAYPNEDGSGKRVLAVVKRRESAPCGLTPTAHPR